MEDIAGYELFALLLGIRGCLIDEVKEVGALLNASLVHVSLKLLFEILLCSHVSVKDGN
jgi:hypothetical protein